MIRYLADENFNGHVYNAVRRQLGNDVIVRAQDVGLDRTPDPLILQWAADEDRILLTHDSSTMTGFAYDRVTAKMKMPGVFEVKKAPRRLIIYDLLLVAQCSEPAEWADQVRYIPL